MHLRALILGGVAIAALTAKNAEAFSLADVADHMPHALLIRSSMKAFVGGATEGFREEAEKFVNDSINPMFDRVDTILRLRIEQAADEAIRVIDQAERSMNAVIDHAGLVVDREIHEFFSNLNATLDKFTANIDGIITNALCKLAPQGKGILVNVTFVPGPAERRVFRPKRSQCWSTFPGARNDPWWHVFDGWQSYKGQICEAEFSINDIDPGDPTAISQVAEAYSELVSLTAETQCSEKADVDKIYLMTKRYEFERNAKFFHDLAGR